MDRQQKVQKSSQDRINDYLGRFRSDKTALPGMNTGSASSLEQYLLERAAEELRAGTARLDKLNQELGKG